MDQYGRALPLSTSSHLPVASWLCFPWQRVVAARRQRQAQVGHRTARRRSARCRTSRTACACRGR
jgi:hypothetical protein